MADFQSQLKQYRERKQREAIVEKFKGRFKKFMMLGTGKDSPDTHDAKINLQTTDNDVANLNEDNRYSNAPPISQYTVEPFHTISSRCESDEEWGVGYEDDENDPRNESKTLKYTLWVLYFLFWVTLYIIAIELKFGLVFLMFSALFGIYFNTRTGPRKQNEISAYSVFNKDCESIDGTLKAEQFEREMRYGAGSVR